MSRHKTTPETGKYHWRLADGPKDLQSAQALRHRVFRRGEGLDQDHIDATCRHILVEESVTGRLVSCFRVLVLPSGSEIGTSYSAQYYELSALFQYEDPMLEVGRFCIAPEARDADVLRVGWGALAHIVDDSGAKMLFGCSSFAGTNADIYRDAFAMLGARHMAPKRWRPRVKSTNVFQFGRRDGPVADLRRALLTMPPLLKSYLAMGGWVSDHAVVDRDLDTMHVFTALEVARIPSARKRALRGIAAMASAPSLPSIDARAVSL